MWIWSKNLIIEVLHRLSRYLCCNFYLFVYTAIHHVCENCEHFHYYMGIWRCRCPFLHSLDVPVKVFANSLAVLNLQKLGRADHVHCFQTQMRESCWLVWFWVDKRPICCFFFCKKSLDIWTRFCVDISIFVVAAERGTHYWTHVPKWLFKVHKMWGAPSCMPTCY